LFSKKLPLLLLSIIRLRYGLAQEKLGNFDKAKQLVLKAKATSPLDASITRSLLEVKIVYYICEFSTNFVWL